VPTACVHDKVVDEDAFAPAEEGPTASKATATTGPF